MSHLVVYGEQVWRTSTLCVDRKGRVHPHDPAVCLRDDDDHHHPSGSGYVKWHPTFLVETDLERARAVGLRMTAVQELLALDQQTKIFRVEWQQTLQRPSTKEARREVLHELARARLYLSQSGQALQRVRQASHVDGDTTRVEAALQSFQHNRRLWLRWAGLLLGTQFRFVPINGRRVSLYPVDPKHLRRLLHRHQQLCRVRMTKRLFKHLQWSNKD